MAPAKKSGSEPVTTIEKMAEQKPRKFADVAERRAKIVRTKLTRPVWTWAQVAAEAGVSERHAFNVWKEWKEQGQLQLSREEALELFHEHLAGLQLLRTDLAQVADSAYQDTAKIAALREMASLLRQEIELRQEYGQIPKELGYLSVEVDLRYVSAEIIRIFERHQLIDGPAGEDLLRVLEGQLPAHYRSEQDMLDEIEETEAPETGVSAIKE